MISIEIDKASLACFEKNISSMIRATGREAGVVVRNAGRDLVFAAVRNTPIAPKYEDTADKSGNYVVRLFHRFTGRMVTFMGSRSEAKKGLWSTRKRVPNRGFAKAAWLACLPALGVAPRQTYPGGNNKAANYKTVSLRDLGCVISNHVPFIEDMDKGRNRSGVPLNILEKSMSDVSSRWEKILEKMAQRAQEAVK